MMINGGRWKDGGCPIFANVLRVVSWLEMDGSSLSNKAVLDNHCTSTMAVLDDQKPEMGGMVEKWLLTVRQRRCNKNEVTSSRDTCRVPKPQLENG
jgi:hypothetical protein